ncbi:MAG: DUF1722 domain-containing protein [Bacteriovoracaceae bacterium]|nr:DUF1722 domain-containing protein [Bacteriovoracaceae bacterium]
MNEKISIGVSTCLLGEEVRYDGGHKFNPWIVNVLGKIAELIPACPEHECGMSIPRGPMRLEGTPDNTRLIVIDSGMDLTAKLNKWVGFKIKKLKKENLDGYIFKTKSPSCGLKEVELFGKNGKVRRNGKGLFARAFVENFSFIPVVDERQLENPAIREKFIDSVYVMKHYRKMMNGKKTYNKLVTFHRDHEILILSNNAVKLKEMNILLSEGSAADPEKLYSHYFKKLISLFF